MKKYIHISFFFFLLTALSGVWMRYYLISPTPAIPYDHLLHAHSHIALLGWIFIAIFSIFLSIFWKEITAKKHALMILFALFIVSLFMFFAFLYQGYALFSIILSALHVFIEYWAAVFIIKQIKQLDIPKVSRNFAIGGIIALILSSIGPYGLAVISMMGMKEHPIYEMAIYFYLHFQYNGWLTLFLIALLSIYFYRKNIAVNKSLMNKGFWIYFISIFPSFLLSILWADLGRTVEILAAIGSVLQWVGIILILLSLKHALISLRNEIHRLTWILLLITFALLFIKSTMELGLIPPELASLVNDTRNVIIGYLHLALLGFISIFILTLYQLIGVIQVNKYTVYSFSVFLTGFIYNEMFLFLDALGEWTGLYSIAYFNENLFAAAVVLCAGVILMWTTVKRETREQRRKHSIKNAGALLNVLKKML